MDDDHYGLDEFQKQRSFDSENEQSPQLSKGPIYLKKDKNEISIDNNLSKENFTNIDPSLSMNVKKSILSTDPKSSNDNQQSNASQQKIQSSNVKINSTIKQMNRTSKISQDQMTQISDNQQTKQKTFLKNKTLRENEQDAQDESVKTGQKIFLKQKTIRDKNQVDQDVLIKTEQKQKFFIQNADSTETNNQNENIHFDEQIEQNYNEQMQKKDQIEILQLNYDDPQQLTQKNISIFQESNDDNFNQQKQNVDDQQQYKQIIDESNEQQEIEQYQKIDKINQQQQNQLPQQYIIDKQNNQQQQLSQIFLDNDQLQQQQIQITYDMNSQNLQNETNVNNHSINDQIRKNISQEIQQLVKQYSDQDIKIFQIEKQKSKDELPKLKDPKQVIIYKMQSVKKKFDIINRPEFTTSNEQYRQINQQNKYIVKNIEKFSVIDIYCPNDKKFQKKKFSGSQSPTKFRNTSPLFYRNNSPQYKLDDQFSKKSKKELSEVETSVKTISFFKELANVTNVKKQEKINNVFYHPLLKHFRHDNTDINKINTNLIKDIDDVIIKIKKRTFHPNVEKKKTSDLNDNDLKQKNTQNSQKFGQKRSLSPTRLSPLKKNNKITIDMKSNYNTKNINDLSPTRLSKGQEILNFNGKIGIKKDPRQIKVSDQIRKLIEISDVKSTKNKLLLDDKYLLGDIIGQGTYAKVRIAINQFTKKKFAIKIYEKYKLLDVQRAKNLKREIAILEILQHEFIVMLHETIDTIQGIYLVMEHCGNLNLLQYLKTLPQHRMKEVEAKEIFRQVTEAINFCHVKNIVHRDIKLDNILFWENKKVKIIDFGFSLQIQDDVKINNFCGTPTYMAPEIVKKIEYYGKPADVWALGILLFTLMTRNFPFRARNEQALYARISKGTFEIPTYVSKTCQELIKTIIVSKPENRPTCIQILQHEWFHTPCENEKPNSYQSIPNTKLENKDKLDNEYDP